MSLLFTYFAQQALRRKRLISDTPTSKTTGVFIGMTELKGSAECSSPLTSFLDDCRCVHYYYEISKHWSRTVTESYTDSKGNRKTRTRRESGWKTVDSGGSMISFYLRDDSGVLLIQPEGAKIEGVNVFSETYGRGDSLYYGKRPSHSVSNSDHRRRFTEYAVPLHQPVFIVGKTRERADIAAAEIAQDDEAFMFLISTRSEKEVSVGFGWKHIGHTFLALFFALIAWPLMLNVQGRVAKELDFGVIRAVFIAVSSLA